MAFRNVRSGAAPRPPRLKDVPAHLTNVEPPAGRDQIGRFVPGNKVAIGRGLRELIGKSIGLESDNPVVRNLFKQTRTLFRSLMKELPSDVSQVQDRVAAQARWSILSAFFSTEAAKVGLTTDDGRKLSDLALKADARAERNGVTALDLAIRFAKREQPTGDTPWFETEGETAEESSTKNETPAQGDSDPTPAPDKPLAYGKN